MKKLFIAILWISMLNGFAEKKEIKLIGDKIIGEFQISFNSANIFTTKDTVYFNDEKLFSFYKSGSVLAVCGAGGEFGLILNAKLSSAGGIGKRNDTLWSSATRYPEIIDSFEQIPKGMDQKLINDYEANKDTLRGFPVGYISTGSCSPMYDYSIDSAYNRIFYIELNGNYFKFQISGYVAGENYTSPLIWSKYISYLKIKYCVSRNKNDIGGIPVSVTNKKSRSETKFHKNRNSDFLGRQKIKTK